jgi:glyoxylase-like metal-dependent hydrolase (beta-lactamase superfamily II)
MWVIVMHVEIFPVGMLLTNCYVVSCVETKEAVIIDPGWDFCDEAQPIFSYIEREGLKVRGIINTHGHQDHINGDVVVQGKFGVPVYIHERDVYFLARLENHGVLKQVLLKDGDTVVFGGVCLKVMYTPGHTMGSVCLIGEKVMFSGDTLFAESIGRTDFVESSPKDMAETLKKLTTLPDELLVYPGHDEVTLMGQEKRTNPFLVNA